VDIKLTPKLEEWVRERMDTGLYQSESEVIREALRIMLRQQEQWESRRDELRGELQEGLDQLDRGEGRAFDASAVADIKDAGRKRLGRDS
jgi:antitoxin ParD1/3/4